MGVPDRTDSSGRMILESLPFSGVSRRHSDEVIRHRGNQHFGGAALAYERGVESVTLAGALRVSRISRIQSKTRCPRGRP